MKKVNNNVVRYPMSAVMFNETAPHSPRMRTKYNWRDCIVKDGSVVYKPYCIYCELRGVAEFRPDLGKNNERFIIWTDEMDAVVKRYAGKEITLAEASDILGMPKLAVMSRRYKYEN